MSENETRTVLLDTTAEAIRLAKALIRTARSGAIATLEPETGWPVATRVGVSTDFDGTPVILISRLAAHTKALLADPRCSLLIGTPGKGDPLAHARVSLASIAREVERDSAEHKRIDARYLVHQRKAELYAGLGDFRYFRLEVQSASLNAGFGRAYALAGADVLNANPANAALAAAEMDALEHMNDDHAEAVGLYAEFFAKAPAGNWRLIGIDAEGIDIVDGDDVRRVWFDTELTSPHDMHMTLVRMAGEARRGLARPLQDARAGASDKA
jgi:putative heme iron utilization protein